MASFGKSFGASFARVTSHAIGYAELTLTATGVAHFEAAVQPPVEEQPPIAVGGGIPVLPYLSPLLRPKRVKARGYAELTIIGQGRAHFEQPMAATFTGRGSVSLSLVARARGEFVNVERDDEEFFALAA